MKYLTEIKVENFRPYGEVFFTFSDGEVVKGKICISHPKEIFISMIGHANSYIFDQLKVYETTKFVENIVGYSMSGIWPPVKSIPDLRKVLNALTKVNRPCSIQSTEYPIQAIPESNKPTVNITIRSKHHSELNFKL